jgi:hypothetical protein
MSTCSTYSKLLTNHLNIGCIALLLVLGSYCKAQTAFTREDKEKMSQQFESGKVQFGVGLSLKVDLIRNTFGYFRISVTGGAGIPFGKEFGWDRNSLIGYYFLEVDVFRGGLGAPALALDNQKMLSELRQSFLLSVGRTLGDQKYNYNRPVVQFISNSSHPLFDPYNFSFTIGSTFVNGINVRRSQRVGIVSLGYNEFQLAYLNDGPPFVSLPFGDGFDRWWTGSGQIGVYIPNNHLLRNFELKYDKFTGLQPYAYETTTALRLKQIPYKSRETRMLNRTRLEFSVGTTKGIGFSVNVYDNAFLDVQNHIHHNKYSYHGTPLKWRIGSGLFYNNTFIIE